MSVFKSTRKRLQTAAASLVLICGLTLATADPAAASTWHNNTDPVSTGCVNSASYVGTRSLWEGYTVEVRYSSACQTNWLRFPRVPWYNYDVVLQSEYPGMSTVTQRFGPSNQASWTRQVYAPGSTCINFSVRMVSQAMNSNVKYFRVC